MLQIATYQDPNYNGQWVTGGTCLCGEPGLLYGAYFVRSRITGPGDDNAELLWPDANVWPPEIDFNETSGPASSSTSTIHWGADNSQQQTSIKVDMTRWHTWGVVWTPTSVIYTVDGRKWGAVTNVNEIPQIPMHLAIQSQTFCSAGWACPASGTTNTEQVDWVAEYQTSQTPVPSTLPTPKKAPPHKHKLTPAQVAAAKKKASKK
jgi:beta-glucanase (GH16 family)